MRDGQKIRVVSQFGTLCDSCQLYAVKFFIWNADAGQLEKVISEALSTLPGKVGMNEWRQALRSSIKSLPDYYLRDLGAQIDVLLSMQSGVNDDDC